MRQIGYVPLVLASIIFIFMVEAAFVLGMWMILTGINKHMEVRYEDPKIKHTSGHLDYHK